MLNLFLQTEPQVENLIVPDSVQKARFTQAVTELANIDIKDVWQQMVEWMIWTGIKVCIALVVFYIGRWLLGKFAPQRFISVRPAAAKSLCKGGKKPRISSRCGACGYSCA